MKGRSITPLSESWDAIFRRFPTQAERSRLSRVMRWLSTAGVEPCDVSAEHVEQFRVALMTTSLRKGPESTWTDLVCSWNKAVAEHSFFPDLRLVRISKQVTYSHPWSHFPPLLKADVDAWLARLAGTDFAVDGPLRSVRRALLGIGRRPTRPL